MAVVVSAALVGWLSQANCLLPDPSMCWSKQPRATVEERGDRWVVIMPDASEIDFDSKAEAHDYWQDIADQSRRELKQRVYGVHGLHHHPARRPLFRRERPATQGLVLIAGPILMRSSKGCRDCRKLAWRRVHHSADLCAVLRNIEGPTVVAAPLPNRLVLTAHAARSDVKER